MTGVQTCALPISISGLQAENGLEAAPVLVLDKDSPVANPAFDVTPARLVTGIITEYGVFAPDKLAASLTGKLTQQLAQR